jgi:hypothetical protein
MLIIFLNDLKGILIVFNQILMLFNFSSPLLAIIHRYQPDLKSKYEADFQISLKDFTKWYFI